MEKRKEKERQRKCVDRHKSAPILPLSGVFNESTRQRWTLHRVPARRARVTSNYRSGGLKIVEQREDRAIRGVEEGRQSGGGERPGIPLPHASQHSLLDVSQLGRQQADLLLRRAAAAANGNEKRTREKGG